MTRESLDQLNTVKRPRNEARLVISLELQVNMDETPSWQTDAIDVVRDRLADVHVVGYLAPLKDALQSLGIKAFWMDYEVSK
jgi:hypothetical protein